MKNWWSRLTNGQKLGLKIGLSIFVIVMVFIFGLAIGGYLTVR